MTTVLAATGVVVILLLAFLAACRLLFGCGVDDAKLSSKYDLYDDING